MDSSKCYLRVGVSESLYRQAAEVARTQGVSIAHVVRSALKERLLRTDLHDATASRVRADANQ
jgi:hypothetical protein